MISLDGSILEGGGQILRNCVAYSAILGIPISINNIRGNRSNPGLRAQHLHGIKLVTEICQGVLTGGKVGSSEITLTPNGLKNGIFIADTLTAGSICLLIQCSLPCLLFTPGLCTVTYKGGTNASLAPQIDFTEVAFKPIIKKFGIDMDLQIEKRGYFPKGGGIVLLNTTPVVSLKNITVLEKGELVYIKGRIFISGNLPNHVGREMKKSAKSLIDDYLLKENLKIPFELEVIRYNREQSFGTGSGIFLYSYTTTGCIITGSNVLEKNNTAEETGRKAAETLVSNLKHGGCMDEYLTDQLIIFMALAKGVTRIRVGPLSLHTKTAIHFSEILSGAKFIVTPDNIVGQDSYIIECEGIGYK